MSTAWDVIGMVAEILSWLGVAAVLAIGIVTVIVLTSAGQWHSVNAVLDDDDPDKPVVRWFGRDGVGSAAVPDSDRDRWHGRRESTVWVHPERHDSYRVRRSGRHGRPLVLILIGTVLFTAVMVVLSFLPLLLG